MYCTSSMMDCGTLYQLRNLISRKNVVKSPKESFTACEDFFLLVVEAHIVSAILKCFEMSSLDDTPCKSWFPEGSASLNPLERRNVMMLAVHTVVEKFVDISFGEKKKREKKRGKGKQPEDSSDRVYAYACGALTHGLLYMEFRDAIREGDGQRILRCWRYFLMLFKETKRTNYSGEAFTLLAQHHFLLSPREAMQLLWNRTVNVHGHAGRNISCDLHMEHLNREAKSGITGIGSNVKDGAVKRVGKSIGHTISVLSNFDIINGIKEPSGRHSKRSTAKDMKLLLKQLQDSNVFNEIPGRRHKSFPKFEANPTLYLSVQKITQWMEEKVQKLLTFHQATVDHD